MKLAKRIKLYETAPWGYRIVYEDILERVGVAYPVGLHWIAIAIYRLWLWSHRWPVPSKWEHMLTDTWSSGYRAGKLNAEAKVKKALTAFTAKED